MQSPLLLAFVVSCAVHGFSHGEEAPLCESTAAEGHWDASALLQHSVGSTSGGATSQRRPLPPQIGSTVASFVPGELVEVKEWIPCNISGEGGTPDTYNVQVPAKVGSQEVYDIHVRALRRPGSAGGSAKHYAAGEAAEVFGWTKCKVKRRSNSPATYDVLVPTPAGGRAVNDVPAAQMRKLHGSHWLHVGDPAVPSRIPGQDGGGICDGEEDCAKMRDHCVALKRAEAAHNCGGRCDLVFVGDSLLERLLGKLCYSGGRPFTETAKVFQQLVTTPHPKSLVVACSSDETAQTLHMLDEVLPVLKAPRVYMVLIGTNNIPKGGSANALRGIRAVLRKLREEHPTSHILIHALLPRADDGPQHVFQDHIDEVNFELADLAHGARAAGAPVWFVNCTALLHPRAVSEEHFEDGLHLTPEGYQAWLYCVIPLLDQALTDTGLLPAKLA